MRIINGTNIRSIPFDAVAREREEEKNEMNRNVIVLQFRCQMKQFSIIRYNFRHIFWNWTTLNAYNARNVNTEWNANH